MQNTKRASNVVAIVVPEAKRTRMFLANYKLYTAHYDYNSDLLLNECKVDEMIGRWHNLSDEFTGMEILFHATGNINPFLPAKIKLFTPNGVFAVNTVQICTSMSTYHADQYPASLGMCGFVRNMMNALVNYESLGEGLNVLVTSTAHKKNLSTKSRAYNRTHHMDLILQLRETPYNRVMLAECNRFPAPVSALLQQYIDLP